MTGRQAGIAAPALRALGRGLGALLILPILVYRYTLSPMLGPRCRFAPSCSEYAIEAIRLHGPLAGLGYGLRRIVRCHPLGGSGYDPVPEPGPGGAAADRVRAAKLGTARPARVRPDYEQKA